MLIKDKNRIRIWIKTMAELYTRIDIIEKKIDDISIYNKKVESAKRMDRYVDEGLTRGRTTNLTHFRLFQLFYYSMEKLLIN